MEGVWTIDQPQHLTCGGSQEAMRRLFRVQRDLKGKSSSPIAPLSGMAPIVRTACEKKALLQI